MRRRYSEGCQVKMEVEIGVMLPQATEHLKPPESGRGRKDSLRAFGGGTALLTPRSNFWSPELGENKFLSF